MNVNMKGKSLISINYLSLEEINAIFEFISRFKKEIKKWR
jgi:hypothetical protein